MKEFNISYLKQIEEGEARVVTKHGYPVRILCCDRVAKISGDGPIVALVETSKNQESIINYFENGKCCRNSDSNLDLLVEV